MKIGEFKKIEKIIVFKSAFFSWKNMLQKNMPPISNEKRIFKKKICPKKSRFL